MFVVDAAVGLGLVGWVANERDAVRCVAEGPEDALRLLLEALREGPPGARVEWVDESWLPASGTFARFEVRAGWHAGD